MTSCVHLTGRTATGESTEELTSVGTLAGMSTVPSKKRTQLASIELHTYNIIADQRCHG